MHPSNGQAPLARLMPPRSVLRADSNDPPRLIVLVVAEEEFDWSSSFNREATATTAIPSVLDAQRDFDAFGITPTYAADWPVIEDPKAAEVLGGIAADGRALIGTHLHPWVTPPHDEEVITPNSFPGNLGIDLERAKLERLTKRIQEVFGQSPTIYQAGRYGLGPNSPKLLAELGYKVDLSTTPPFDYSHQGGPDYSQFPPDPYWWDEPGGLLEIPTTGAYLGFLGHDRNLTGAPKRAHSLYRAATGDSLRWTRLPGVLARFGALERMRLTPEGFSLQDLKRLTRSLLNRGTRIFNFSYHAPSLKPGCTEYVRNDSDLKRFHACCRGYFEFFLNELGGQASTPIEVHEHFMNQAATNQD